MSKEINLDNIIEDLDFSKEVQFDVTHNGYGVTMFTQKAVKIAMKEACRQTLELSAENAKILHEYYDKYDNYKKYCEFAGTFTERCDGDGIPYGVDVYDVNKKSILDTINQIK